MVQTIINKGIFDLVYNSDKQLLTYVFNDGATCSIWPNESDKEHGINLNLSPIQHKIIHELAHHYIAKSLGYKFCPIVYAEAHNLPMPENANYLEEIVFTMVYFCCETPMLYNNWYSYLDRLPKNDIHVIKHTIISKFLRILRHNEETIL